MDAQTIKTVLVAIPAFLIALTYHEIAHAYVADRLGDSTARMLGRLSPNPLKHLDPFYTLAMPILMHIFFGFALGGAKPVPVNPMNLRNPKQDMALVAAAGPLTNIALALGSAVGLRWLAPLAHPAGVYGVLSTYNGAAYDPHGIQIVLLPISLVLFYSVWINVVLAIFNLMPIPPLDGSSILISFLPDSIAEPFAAIERYGFMILIGVLVIADRTGFWGETILPIFQNAVKILIL